MRKLLIVLFTFISISSVFAQQDERLEGIENDLNAILEATQAPGFAVAVVEGKNIIYAKGFGYRDYEQKILWMLIHCLLLVHVQKLSQPLFLDNCDKTTKFRLMTVL